MHEETVLTPDRKDGKPSPLSLWLPVVSWMLVVFLFSTDTFSGDETGDILKLLLGWALPEQTLNLFHFAIRKSAHITEYAVLSLLLYRALNSTLLIWRLKTAYMSFFLSFLYAMTDEFHQTLTMNRTGSPWDVMIDSLGAFIAIPVIRIMWSLSNEHK